MALTRLQQNPDNIAWSGTIAAEGTESDEFPLGGRRFIKIYCPTITSATLSFNVRIYPGGDLQPLYDDAGNEYTVGSAMTGDRVFLLPWLTGMHSVQIVSGTHGSPVQQGAERTFIVAASTRS